MARSHHGERALERICTTEEEMTVNEAGIREALPNRDLWKWAATANGRGDTGKSALVWRASRRSWAASPCLDELRCSGSGSGEWMNGVEEQASRVI